MQTNPTEMPVAKDPELKRLQQENAVFRSKLTEMERSNRKLTQLVEDQYADLDPDMAFVTQELQLLLENTSQETNAENIKGYISMFQMSLWTRFVNKFGFDTIEDMNEEGYNLNVISQPTLRLRYDPKKDTKIPESIPDVPADLRK